MNQRQLGGRLAMQLVLLLCLASLASHPAAQQQQQRLHDTISKWGGSSGSRSHRGDSSVDRSSNGSGSSNGSSRSSGGGRRYSSDGSVERGSSSSGGSGSRRFSDSSNGGGRGSRITGISSGSRGVSNSGSSGSGSGRISKSSERQLPPEWGREYAWPLKRLPPYRACEESDMCSVGKTQPFIGDVNPSAGLHAALQARAYKREIIFIPASNNPYFMTLAVQLVSNLEYLGFAHVLLLANHERTCRVIAAALPDIGCAWDSSPWIRHSMDPTWFLRAKMNVRVPRLGYNTLMMDADSIIFQDPYRAFQAPGLRDVHYMCMSEASHGIRACYCNGGFVRVQNVKPDGAVTWMFKEFITRVYKNMDDGYEMQRSHGMVMNKEIGWYVLAFDQSALHDTMTSAIARRPLYPWVMFHWAAWSGNQTLMTERLKLYERSKAAARCHERAVMSTGHPLPPTLQSTLGTQSLDHEYWPLFVPDSGSQHNETEYGPVLVPEVPGGLYSNHFERQLREDCPDCPWWPDVNGPRTAQHDASRELYAIPPEWLIGNAWHRAQPGYWAAPPGYYAPQVVGHVHVLSELTKDDNSKALKRAFQMHLGYSPGPVDWQLIQRLQASLKASLPDLLTNTRPISGFSAVQPHPRIILINPNLDLSSLRTPRHYQLLAFGLAQLAALSNRSLVWPAVDCASPLFPRVPLTAFSLFDSYYHPPAVNASFGYPHTSIYPQREQQHDTNGQAATINPNGQRTGESLAESWAASVLEDAAADAGQRRAAAQQLRVPSLALPFFSTLVDRMQCMPLAALCLGCLQALSREQDCPLPALLPNELPHWMELHGIPSLEPSDKVAWLRRGSGGLVPATGRGPNPTPGSNTPPKGFFSSSSSSSSAPSSGPSGVGGDLN